MLLGLIREDRILVNRFLGGSYSAAQILAEIERHVTPRERISTSVEVPLTDECKKILHFAAEEADRLGQRYVGTEHLLLAMLRMEGSVAGHILLAKGLKAAEIREQLGKNPNAANVRVRPDEVTSELIEMIREELEGTRGAENVRLQPSNPAFHKLAAIIRARLERTRGKPTGKLEDFLSGLKWHSPDKLKSFFAKTAQFVDVHGKRWNREEIDKEFETLFAPYAKKNAAYTIEDTIQDIHDTVVAIVLWRNAILASMERVWMHRMSIVLVPEGEEWAIALVQVTPVKPS